MDFGNDGAGTWYSRKEDVDSLPLKMVFANREGDMESASFMCRQGDKSVYGSEWTWTYEKRTGGQSSDYAEAMVGNGVML